MTRADFTTCGRNILPEPNRSPDHVHAVHERPFDHVERPHCREPRLLGVREHELVESLHQRMLQPLLHGELAPLEIVAALDASRRP